jgi:UDP-arabinose 4-epimerase
MEWTPQAVIHFAAFAYVGESVAEPDRYYRNNVAGTLTLLEAMRLTGITDIVFSSSCATYGAPDELPIRETTAQRPINPYGETKLICERMLRDFTNAYGFRHVVLRYFNACGADRDGELSERHDPETHLIPRALMAASGRLKRIDLFGADYNTPDGTCIRDYIHVEDLADGHVRALEYIGSNQQALSVNLGSGKGASVIEILADVQRVTGKEVPKRTLPRRAGDPAALYADVSLAQEKLGFQTRFSDIETIIRTAARSFGFAVV